MIAVLASAHLSADTPADARYVGVGQCRMCHPNQYESWQGKKHAHVFQLLVNVGHEKDEKCAPCHTTGYGKPTGFVSVDQTPNLTDV